MKLFLNGIIIVGGIFMAGCSSMNAVQPVTMHKISKNDDIVVLSTASDRRLAIVETTNGKTCLEPPPDATMNVSASLSAALSAKAENQTGITPSANGSYADNLAKALSHIQQPTQGILLYRNIASSLCNLYVNGAIDATAYSKLLTGAIEEAVRLTYHELDLTNGKVGPEVKVSDGAPPLPTTSTTASASDSSAASSAGNAAKAAATAATSAAIGDPKKAAQAGAAAEQAATSSVPANATTEQKAEAASVAASAAVTVSTKDQKLGDEAGKAAANAILNQSKPVSSSTEDGLTKRMDKFQDTLKQSIEGQAPKNPNVQ